MAHFGAYGDLDSRRERAVFRGLIAPVFPVAGILVSTIGVRRGVYLVLMLTGVFVTGVRSIQRESCVQKFPRAILATLIAISTFATQTCRAIVVPLPSLLKSTSMKCLCLPSRVFFLTFISSRILSASSCCCLEESPSITWCTSLFLYNHCLCVIVIRLLMNLAPHMSIEPLGMY